MKTLICTVGGSREPILAAIRFHRPDRVIFVCSRDDEATKARGSYIEVESKNPSIPTEAGLSDGTWRVVRVPSDDPATAILTLQNEVARAALEGCCVADYTGGTKSMCAALFFVAAQAPNVQLSLVTGPRANLVQITPGLERVRAVSNVALQRGRLREQLANCWRDFRYADACLLAQSAPTDLRDTEIDRLEHLSSAFALWDASDHGAAQKLLGNYARYAALLMPPLRALTSPDTCESDAVRIVDVYASVERRESSVQYDAAVLRLYRVLEWIAQWSLRWHCDIDTNDVSASSPITDIAHRASKDRLALGCESAWNAIARLEGPLKGIASSRGDGIRDLARKRNESLLTHGRRILGPADVRSCRLLLEAAIWPAFLEVSRVRPYQLPREFPDADGR